MNKRDLVPDDPAALLARYGITGAHCHVSLVREPDFAVRCFDAAIAYWRG